MPVKVIHLVISLSPGGLERLVVEMVNGRNGSDNGSATVCCLDELGGLADQVRGDAVFCVNAKRSRFPWDSAAVRAIRKHLTTDPTSPRLRGTDEHGSTQIRSGAVLDAASSSGRVVMDGSEVDQASSLRSHLSSAASAQEDPSSLLLHAHNMAAWQYAVLAAKGTDAKVVVTHHGSNLYTCGIVNSLRNRWLVSRTDAVVAVSKSVKRELLATWGFRGAEICVVPNGISCQLSVASCQWAKTEKAGSVSDTGGKAEEREKNIEQKTTQPSPKATAGTAKVTKKFADTGTACSMRLQLGIPADAFVVGSVGRFSDEKNYPLLVRAFSLFSAKHPDSRLVLVGDGPARPGIERAVKECSVGERCLLPGFQDDVHPWLRIMDIFCLSSDSEGLSLALLEAGACGIPAIVTDVGGNSEVVRHGVDGLVVPKGDCYAFAGALENMAANPGKCKEMASSFSARVAKEYSFASMMQKYEAIYSQGSL